jgi:peptidyl-prolyl cis-trans isomerase B (cyclophilin B)
MLRLAIILTIALAAIGCRGEQPAATEPARPEAFPPAVSEQPEVPEAPPVSTTGSVTVKLETDKGVIELELDPAAAPKTVENFVKLVKEGFYDGMPFHRVEPSFVIQAGDPALVGKPPVGYTIPDEPSPVKHTRGVIAMARIYRGNAMVPNSASTQFYITLADTPHLDQAGFTAFGRVTKGMEVVDKIAVGDKIVKASVVE